MTEARHLSVDEVPLMWMSFSRGDDLKKCHGFPFQYRSMSWRITESSWAKFGPFTAMVNSSLAVVSSTLHRSSKWFSYSLTKRFKMLSQLCFTEATAIVSMISSMLTNSSNLGAKNFLIRIFQSRFCSSSINYSRVMVSNLLTNSLYWDFISSSGTSLRSWTGIFFTALNHSGNNISAALRWDCFFLTLTAIHPNKRLLAGLDDQLHVFSHLHCHFQQPSQDLGLKYVAA